MATAAPLTMGPPDPGPAAKAFGGGLGILPNPMFYQGSANTPTAPTADPQAPPDPNVAPRGAGLPAQIAQPPSVMDRLGGVSGLIGAVRDHLVGPVAEDLNSKAAQNFAQGNVGAGIGNVIGAGLGGAAHAIVTPAVDTAMATGALGMGVAHFAHNVYNGLMGNPAVAAPLPAQAVAPAAAPAAVPGGVAELPAISPELAAAKAAQFEATPTIPGRYGDWTPGSTGLHGVVPLRGGPGIALPGAAPAANTPPGTNEILAMRAAPVATAPAQGGLPGAHAAIVNDDGVGTPRLPGQSKFEHQINARPGTINHLLATQTPNNALAAMERVVGMQSTMEALNQRRSYNEMLDKQFLAGATRQPGEDDKTFNARRAKEAEDYQKLKGIGVTPGASSALMFGQAGLPGYTPQ